MQATILISGNDAMLLTTRRMIFEQAGYTVFTTDSVSNARLVLMNHQIDVLVLCQSLDDNDRASILRVAHLLQPDIKCASLSFDGREVAIDDAETHRGLSGPPSLLAAIGQMLQQSTAELSANLQRQ